jgi:hypothetical protein
MRCVPGFSGFVAMINAFVIFTMGILITLCPCPTSAAFARYEEPRQAAPKYDEHELPEQPRSSLPPSDRLLIPELGDNDTGVDIKVEKVEDGLKVTQRVTHADGKKTVTSYTKHTPPNNWS